MSLQQAITRHLEWWGLRRFETDDVYFRWQRETLTPDELTELRRLAEKKRTASADVEAETAFYDRTAEARILPVLYSQRYDYYHAVGSLVADRIGRTAGDRAAVLDAGCGIGLLTTFYASQFPHLRFVGVDRSARSVAEAQKRAEALGLRNVAFQCRDLAQAPLGDTYDLIVSTQTLLQAEQDPGLPSRTWQTFERAKDPAVQARFEERTGLRQRLNPLCQALAPDGRLVVFEKARLLSRRIPFQRAFVDRGFRLLEPPVPVRYRIVEEISDDGPLYVMTRAGREQGGPAAGDWDELPEPSGDSAWYRCTGRAAALVRDRLPDRIVLDEQQADSPFGTVKIERGQSGALLAYYCWDFRDKNRQFALIEPRWGKEQAGAGHDQLRPEHLSWPPSDETEDPDHAPLYEIHNPSAQHLWESLPGRTMVVEKTWLTAGGYHMHVELGTAGGLVYLYQANTVDQRQLVMMEAQRRAWLEEYYQEIVQSAE